VSSLSDIHEKLLDTQEIVARLEQRLVLYPDSEHLRGNLRSAHKRQRVLEQAFAREANKAGVEVCSYRLFTEEGMPSIAALAKALDSFQTLVSLIYDALKNGPKKRGRLNQETVKETSLSLGYTFSGSIGMVLTLPTPRPLRDDIKPLLDKSMYVLFQMAKATTTMEIMEFASLVGRPPIKALSEWAKALTDHDLGADIEWEGPHETKNMLFIQTPELQHLSKISAEMSELKPESLPQISNDMESLTIQRTGMGIPTKIRAKLSEPTEKEIEEVGHLVGADVHRQTFHLILLTGDDITGTFTDSIDSELPIELSKLYRARLRKTTRVGYPTAEYLLLALEPLSPK
jgi:hypothetical protein